MGKLPYIPDKKMYAAVMGACSYIRKTGWFNKATEYYADKYDVSLDEVQKYVRIAQSNGQKKANSEKLKRKYSWFAVEYSLGNERNGGAYFEYIDAHYTVAKGLTKDTVMNRLSQYDDVFSEYAPLHWFGRVEGFPTKDEATRKMKEWKKQHEADIGRC